MSIQAATPLNLNHSLVASRGIVKLYGGGDSSHNVSNVNVKGVLTLLKRNNVGAPFGVGKAVIASETLKVYDLERGKNTGGLGTALPPPTDVCVQNRDSLLLQVGKALYRVDARVKDGAPSQINTGGRKVCGITQVTDRLATYAFLEKEGSTHSNATGLAMIDVRGAPKESPCHRVEGLSLSEEVKIADSMPVGDGRTLVAVASEHSVGLVLMRDNIIEMQYKLLLCPGPRVRGIHQHKMSNLDDDDEDEGELSSCVITVITDNNYAISYKIVPPKEGEEMVVLLCDKVEADVICYGKNDAHPSHALVVRGYAPTEIQHVWYEDGEVTDDDES